MRTTCVSPRPEVAHAASVALVSCCVGFEFVLVVEQSNPVFVPLPFSLFLALWQRWRGISGQTFVNMNEAQSRGRDV